MDGEKAQKTFHIFLHYGTVKTPISLFFENFSLPPKGPLSDILQHKGC